jgi:hypothetical protein
MALIHASRIVLAIPEPRAEYGFRLLLMLPQHADAVPSHPGRGGTTGGGLICTLISEPRYFRWYPARSTAGTPAITVALPFALDLGAAPLKHKVIVHLDPAVGSPHPESRGEELAARIHRYRVLKRPRQKSIGEKFARVTQAVDPIPECSIREARDLRMAHKIVV